jgi:hypothetical protein
MQLGIAEHQGALLSQHNCVVAKRQVSQLASSADLTGQQPTRVDQPPPRTPTSHRGDPR